jgi:hypothetical protein
MILHQTSGGGKIDDGVGEINLDGLGGLEPGLEGVAQGHQFVDFGDNAVLLLERW